MKNTVSRVEVKMTESMSKFGMNWDECFDPIMLKELEDFQLNVMITDEEDPNFYIEDVKELSGINNPGELFDFVINHNYWVRVFTVHLFNQMIWYTYQNE